MHKYLLMPSRMNQVLQEIEKQNLNPREFEWTEEPQERIPMVADEGLVSVLLHRPTAYTFCFDLRGDRYSASFSPGHDAPRRHEICENLPQVMGHFVLEWLPSLKREIDAPDLWSELSHATTLTEATRTADDTAFTPEQREQLIQGIAKTKRWLLQHDQVRQNHVEFVNARLAYLESTIDRMPRNDWLHTAIGVFFTIAVGVGLAPDQARELFRVAGDALTQVVAGAVKLLQ